jgi:hypothetical protein
VTHNPVLALFPQEWRRNPDSAWLHSAHLDVPWEDPEVLRACLAPGQPAPKPPAAAANRAAAGLAFAAGKAPAAASH